jgi:hypothetical protein
MISIDFVAGSHGHFLEYICNTFIANIPSEVLPFNKLGASHIKSKDYNKNKLFVADHYSENNLPLSDKIIRITFEHDDLLTLTSGAFLRAGDVGIEDNLLETDTYNKLLNSKYYTYLIDTNNSAYPYNQISAGNPDCPRYILREFFKFGFKHPEKHGFIGKLDQLKYGHSANVVDFSYKNFYNYELFERNIKELASAFNATVDADSLKEIWEIFISKQIFKDRKTQCDLIIDKTLTNQNFAISALSLLQESYINGILEKQFEIEMPFYQPQYFTSTKEIRQHLCLK